MLGLTIKKHGYSNHIKNRVAQCRLDMNNLYRLWNLSERNKNKLYKALILSKLTYLPVTTHCLSKHQISQLQTIHSKGARFIAGISRMERHTNEYIHKKINLPPLNHILYKRAFAVWGTIRDTMRHEWESLLSDLVPKKNWPLSISTVLEGHPPPLYR